METKRTIAVALVAAAAFAYGCDASAAQSFETRCYSGGELVYAAVHSDGGSTASRVGGLRGSRTYSSGLCVTGPLRNFKSVVAK